MKAELREVLINVFATLLVQIAVVAIKLLFPSLDPNILSLIAAIVVAAVLLCLLLGRRGPGARYHIRIAVVIVATVLVLLASFVVRDPSLKLSPSVPYEATIVEQYLVSVPADQYWSNTGVEVQRGDYVELEARGHWYSGISITGPKGDRGIKTLLGLRRCGQCPVVGGNLGELVGKVGSNSPFRVGSSAVRFVAADGSLWLTMNDSTGSCWGGGAGSCYGDNHGALEVKVTVSRVKSSQNDMRPGQTQTIDNANITLLRQLAGHSDLVSSIAFSPDGYTLASSSWDKTIKLWDAQTGDLRRTLVGHDASVTLVTFSPDGGTVASGSGIGRMSGSFDTSVRLWDTQTGDLIHTLKVVDNLYSGVTDVAFSPDGSTLAAEGLVYLDRLGGYSHRVVKVWDVQSGKTQIASCCLVSGGSWSFSPDGRSLVTSSGLYPNIVAIWDARTREPKWTLECAGPTPLIFSPDGKLLVVRRDDKTTQIWDMQTREPRRTLETVGPIIFSPDGKFLADGGDDKTVRLWDTQTWNLLRQLAGHAGEVTWVAFSPGGRTFASRTSDGVVKLWDTGVWEVRQAFEALSEDVTSIDLSPDWRTVVYWNSNGTVSLYDAQTGRMKGVLEEDGGAVRGIVFSPDGKTLASRGGGEMISLWRIQ